MINAVVNPTVNIAVDSIRLGDAVDPNAEPRGRRAGRGQHGEDHGLTRGLRMTPLRWQNAPPATGKQGPPPLVLATLAVWRNGRRRDLKSLSFARAGSSPHPPTPA